MLDRPGFLDRFVKKPDPKVHTSGKLRCPHVLPLADALHPQELVRKWQSDVRKESRTLERTIWSIQREEKAAHKNVKEAAKRGDMAVRAAAHSC